MRARVLIGGDLHKRPKDISTMSGYVDACKKVQDDLLQSIRTHNVTHFISLGDWYDKGYMGDVPAALADVEIDMAMADELNGNFYGLIGNHIKLQLDSNPELHLIQPHPVYTSRKMYRQEQIIRTPNELFLDGLQISFMHYINEASIDCYNPVRRSDAKLHVALFHTPLIIPPSKLSVNKFLKGYISPQKIEEKLRGVDFAIVGDIHDPIPPFEINHPDGSKTIMVVPGSLTNTSSHKVHPMISAPMITVEDNYSITISYLPIDLHTNMITINKDSVITEEDHSKLKTFRGKSSKIMATTEQGEVEIARSSIGSLSSFLLENGYGTKKDMDLILSVTANPKDVLRLVEIFVKEEDSNRL